MRGPIQVTERTFEREVLQPAVPVLVDFWASWCPSCRALAPALDEVSREEADRLKVVKIDVDRDPVLADRYGVDGLPTLILFQHGREVGRVVGALPKHALLAHFGKHLIPVSAA
ncbi:MAG: thioredoxin [Chloroflexota bacterium]|nr:MAG: thioredoxin [Chloroflexota bacterium]